MRNDISFAGIALEWTEQYARDYCDKLIEMGFYAKVINDKFVAYSPLPFSRQDAAAVLEQINEGDERKMKE